MEMLDTENDSLRSLEERIHQAVQLVNRLRQEKEAAQQQAAQLANEVEALRAERKQVHMPEPLKEVGTHEVEVKLHPEVTVKLKVTVGAEA